MHVISLERLLLNGIQNKKIREVQKITTFVHISSLIKVVHKCLLFKNEEKLLALLDYSSFVPVTTNGFRIMPYSLVVAVE